MCEEDIYTLVERLFARVFPIVGIEPPAVFPRLAYQEAMERFGSDRPDTRFGLELEPLISYGVSPRASIWLGLAARAHAFLNGRGYVTPQDVKEMAPDVLRHRISLSYEAEAEGKSADDVIATLLERIEVP